MRRLGRPDGGSALVEFVGLATLLMVPVFYLVMAAGRVEGAAFATQSAVEAAGRAYAIAGSDPAGRMGAQAAAEIALADDGLKGARLDIQCGSCAYQPGSAFSVSISVEVPLPGLPAGWCPSRHCLASITVRASHRELLDCFVPGRAVAGC